MKNDLPLTLPIKQIITESPRVKTFVFDYELDAQPGQFVMCWIPGHDEKPFGIVMRKKGEFMITVAAVGKSTQALHQMKVGDTLSFRGPYGSSFTLPASPAGGPKTGAIAMVAGGYGMASLFSLAKEARARKLDVHVFLGARTKDELLYLEWMEEIGAQMHLSTDDGSAGYKGFNTDLFAEYIHKHPPSRSSTPPSPPQADRPLAERREQSGSPLEGRGPGGGGVFSKVYTVGPEIMEMKVAQTCYDNEIPFEVSLERYMKCGFGICGQCCVDPTGWRMCVEGPVIDGEKLRKITEFGKYHRTSSGKIVEYPWVK